MATWVRTMELILAQTPVPFTNRDASGLIIFGKDLSQIAYTGGKSGFFNWYGFALPALKWFRLGDQFDMSSKWQFHKYETKEDLFDALMLLADLFDAQGLKVPSFKGYPSGNERSYQHLASEAWTLMVDRFPNTAQASIRSSRKKASKREVIGYIGGDIPTTDVTSHRESGNLGFVTFMAAIGAIGFVASVKKTH